MSVFMKESLANTCTFTATRRLISLEINEHEVVEELQKIRTKLEQIEETIAKVQANIDTALKNVIADTPPGKEFWMQRESNLMA